jgi:hypothetical protein
MIKDNDEKLRQQVIELCGTDDPDVILSELRNIKEEEVFRYG